MDNYVEIFVSFLFVLALLCVFGRVRNNQFVSADPKEGKKSSLFHHSWAFILFPIFSFENTLFVFLNLWFFPVRVLIRRFMVLSSECILHSDALYNRK